MFMINTTTPSSFHLFFSTRDAQNTEVRSDMSLWKRDDQITTVPGGEGPAGLNDGYLLAQTLNERAEAAPGEHLTAVEAAQS